VLLASGIVACAHTAQGPTTSEAIALEGRWRLASLNPTDQPAVPIGEPDRFVADFQDGRLALLADCNRCGAGYAAGPDTLAVGLMVCTQAFCQSAPIDTQFADLVQRAIAWRVESGRLELSSTGGVLRLER
jgi:heat shock protein HslJ